MKNIRIFLSENFHFLVIKFSVYLNRRVFVMTVLQRLMRLSDVQGDLNVHQVHMQSCR